MGLRTVDSNTIAALALSDLVKNSFEKVIEGTAGQISTTWKKVFTDFNNHFSYVYRKNSNVRIICVKDKDVPLYDIYVPAKFDCSGDTLNDEELVQRAREGQNFVVTGNGGSGKTFFMRHLWMCIFQNPANSIPIFLELRSLNSLTNHNVEAFVRNSISPNSKLDEKLFRYFANLGKFCFIFDGFDEVDRDKRDKLQEEILDLSSNYPDCGFVVSSRFDSRFSGWQNFEVYQASPFDIEQTRQLIENVPFDSQYKSNFLKRLDDDFFSENHDFLSSPLLSIMMLMSFKDNFDTTTKSMNTFYDRTFTTMYIWHDSTKAYERHKCLDIEQFRRSFGVFCLLSYYESVHEFSHTEFISYISKSNSVLGYDFDPDEIRLDYVESVNLMQLDGLNYCFVHRSFQEYFAALALVRVFREQISTFLPRLQTRFGDGLLRMALELDHALITREVITPLANKLSHLPRKQLSTNPLKVFQDIGLEVSLNIDPKTKGWLSSFSVKDTNGDGILNALRSIHSMVSQDKANLFTSFEMVAIRIVSHLEGEVWSRVKPDSPGKLLITFEDNDAQIQFTEHKISVAKAEEITARYKDWLMELKPELVEAAKQMVSELSEARLWCQRHIDEVDRTGSSLAEILEARGD